MSKFSEKLKEMMKEKGMPAGKLADEIGVNDQTLMSWMNGSKEPYEAVRGAICKALGCQMNDLFPSGKGQKTDTQNEVDSPAPVKKEDPKAIEKPATSNDEVESCMPKPIQPAVVTKKEEKMPPVKKPQPATSKAETKSEDKTAVVASFEDMVSAMRSTGIGLKYVPKKPDPAAVASWCAYYCGEMAKGVTAMQKAAEVITNAEPAKPQLSAEAMDIATRYEKLSPQEKAMIRKMLS